MALGDCAVTGNVPAMRNNIAVNKLLERIYVEGADANGIPRWRAGAAEARRAGTRVVKVDLHVPGCPPPAKAIAFVLGELLEGRMPDLAGKVRFG